MVKVINLYNIGCTAKKLERTISRLSKYFRSISYKTGNLAKCTRNWRIFLMQKYFAAKYKI